MSTRAYTYAIHPISYRVTIFSHESGQTIKQMTTGNYFGAERAIISLEEAEYTVENLIEELKAEHASELAAAAMVVTEQADVVEESVEDTAFVSKYDFYTKFTVDELVYLEDTSKVDTKLAVYMKLIDAAKEVDLKNEMLRAALSYMESLNILTPEPVE